MHCYEGAILEQKEENEEKETTQSSVMSSVLVLNTASWMFKEEIISIIYS